MNLDDRDDRTVAVGEYVLGTLDAATRAALEARLATDEALRAEVYVWQDLLLPVASRVPPLEPDSGLWTAIAAQLAELRQSSPAAQGVAALLPAAQAGGGRLAAAPPAAPDPLWRRLRRWQWTAGLGLAASAVLTTLLVLRPPATEPARYLTLLQAPDTQRTGWIVEATAGGQIRLLPVAPAEPVPAGSSLQFWTKLQGAADPTSLGLVTAGVPVRLPAARSPGIGEQQLFELTLEPAQGSPTGKPTGPILFVGRSQRL